VAHRVAVIGAGLAGLTAAWYLVEAGADVTVFERRAGAGLGTSYANGALLHPSACEPWNEPRMLLGALGSLWSRRSTLKVRATALPALVGWGWRFLAGSREAAVLAATRHNVALALYSLELLSELRARAAIEDGAYAAGSLHVFRRAESLERATAWVERLSALGLEARVLSPIETRTIEPSLEALGDRLAGSLHCLQDQGADAHRYCCELAGRLQDRGIRFHFGVAIEQLLCRGGRIAGLRTLDGAVHEADCYLLAAGSDSATLSRTAGLTLPILPVKGYSLTLERDGRETWPRVPVIDRDRHLAVVPLADGRLRVAGLAEFAGHDLRVDDRRAADLEELLADLLPVARSHKVVAWAGLRPMCADGIPIVGHTPVANLYLNTGHGQLGWTLAAGCGRMCADVMLGRASPLDPAPYRFSRFHAPGAGR
jgi:D-amino-acid dehydrogenase